MTHMKKGIMKHIDKIKESKQKCQKPSSLNATYLALLIGASCGYEAMANALNPSCKMKSEYYSCTVTGKMGGSTIDFLSNSPQGRGVILANSATNNYDAYDAMLVITSQYVNSRPSAITLAKLHRTGNKKLTVISTPSINELIFGPFTNNEVNFTASGMLPKITVTNEANNARIIIRNSNTNNSNTVNSLVINHKGSFTYEGINANKDTIAALTIQSGTTTINNAKVQNLTLEGFSSSNVNLKDAANITTIQSGTHNVTIEQASDTNSSASYTQSGGTANITSQLATITSYTQSGGTANITAQNATITSYTQSGGTANITAQNATITSYTQSGGHVELKANVHNFNQGTSSSSDSSNGSTSSTNANQKASLQNYANITILTASMPGTITNVGDIATVNISGQANLTNYNKIQNLTVSSSANAQVTNEGVINYINHNGTGTLSVEQGELGNIQNVSNKSSGSIRFNTLDNVAQSEGISLLTIKNSGGIYVHTMHASLDGNKGKPRVTISNGNGSSSSTSNGKLTVERIVIDSVQGTFNPTAHISATLKDYVTNGTSNTNNISTTNPKMYASQELRDIGIDFYEDGSPKSSANGSLAATLSSLIITQSMRRKLLTDIYLAEQNQASLQKGSEKSVLLSNPTIAKYQKDKAQYDKEIKEWHKLANTPKNKKIIASYEKERAIYEKEKAAYDKAKASKKKSKNLKAPKAPIKPDIIAKRPHLPTNANIDKEVLASLESGVHDVSGDFFIRALGSEGDYNLENGTQTNSYSVGAMLGGGKSIAISSGYGNIGFYGGYEYTNNGYKDSSGFNIDSNIGFAGVRFSHLFLQSKAAGLYYVIDAHGGYGRANLNAALIRDELAYQSSVNLYSYGTTLRLGSTIYLDGVKSILVPSVGAGLDGGMLGAFAMQPYTLNNATMPTHPLRFGSDAEIYNLGYAQANLNYYQALGKSMAMTIGGGARYLLNNDIDIKALINDISLQGTLSLSPLYYYGSAMLSLYASSLGNLSAGYTYIQGGIGKTHNASLRWHYFF